jgi:hypothetical protein
MDLIPDDISLYILNFLSMKERINAREVNNKFKSFILQRIIILKLLDQKMKNVYAIERKLTTDLLYTVNAHFIMYTNHSVTGIHSLFCITNHSYIRCCTADCREKRLGKIYLPKERPPPNYHQYYSWNTYITRFVPYCLNCFNTWG